MHPWVAESDSDVRFAIQGGGSSDWPEIRDLVQAVDELGFDAYYRPDHPMLTPDSWTLLAALAGVTRRLRLGTSVTCIHYRNPAMLARVVADVDRISGGRVVLGLGSGDMEHEFRRMGLDYPPVAQRQAALEEALQIIQPLLRGQLATFQGSHFRVRDAGLPLAPSSNHTSPS
jgi:alkanesulfonate monooxygenase SsuD/methylene tetrahydromethanopterin reductase-like flavin-dependent oxidoreductase (luciferase family)